MSRKESLKKLSETMWDLDTKYVKIPENLKNDQEVIEALKTRTRAHDMFEEAFSIIDELKTECSDEKPEKKDGN